MNTRELPREIWASYFNDLSRRHRGRQVTVQSLTRTGGRGRMLARRLPLMGITAEIDGRSVHALEILVGDSPDDHLMHVLNAPWRVRVGQASNGEDEVLLIESYCDPGVRVDFGPELVGVSEASTAELWR